MSHIANLARRLLTPRVTAYYEQRLAEMRAALLDAEQATARALEEARQARQELEAVRSHLRAQVSWSDVLTERLAEARRHARAWKALAKRLWRWKIIDARELRDGLLAQRNEAHNEVDALWAALAKARRYARAWKALAKQQRDELVYEILHARDETREALRSITGALDDAAVPREDPRGVELGLYRRVRELVAQHNEARADLLSVAHALGRLALERMRQREQGP